MKTLEDEIRHILDYDSEETVALTFKTKARLVKNIVSTVETFYASQSQPTDEQIEKWANSFEHIEDEMPGTLKLHIQKKIECRIKGAKAMRDGLIKHTEK